MKKNNSMDKNETLKKIYAFAVACVSVLGAIGGTAYLFYDRHILFGVTNLCLVAMACPYIYKVVKQLFA